MQTLPEGRNLGLPTGDNLAGGVALYTTLSLGGAYARSLDALRVARHLCHMDIRCTLQYLGTGMISATLNEFYPQASVSIGWLDGTANDKSLHSVDQPPLLGSRISGGPSVYDGITAQ